MDPCACVFERPDLAALADDEVLDHVLRCGTCPKVQGGAGGLLLARLQESARQLRRAGSRARQLTRELADLRVEVDRAEQRLVNLERVQKASTREILQKNAILAMISSITIAANEATSDDVIFQVCMTKVCAATGWSIARVTPLGGDRSRWHVADPFAAPFVDVLRDGELTALGHEALSTGQPTWALDLRAHIGAPWTDRAADLGLRGGAALPVTADGDVSAVVEFFGAANESTGNALRLAMATVGAQLGRVLARRRAEEAAAHARVAAEEANRAKSAFLASMSHELRTPLNAILGYADLVHELLGERGDAELQGDMLRIRQAGEHLLGLINNILDLSKVEAGRMPVVRERFDLAALITEAVALLAPLIERRDNAVVLELGEDLGDVETDPTLVRQLLFNLVSNAAKFTGAGTITVAAARELDAAGALWLRISVADTGIGMTAEQCARIFEPYRHADDRLARLSGGTGLGLTLCRSLCELLGGAITVTSAPERGSCFTVRLPG